MTTIFISYRHKDTAPTAGRIYDRLKDEFEKEDLFMDVVTISAGSNFEDAIEEAIKKADIFLVVLGDKWLSGDNSVATNLLLEPDDYVRKEITTALSNQKQIIPLLIDGAEMPTAALPEELKPFGQCHALRLSNSQFDSDFHSLLVKLFNAVDIAGVPGTPKRVCGSCASRVSQDAIKCPSCGADREDVKLLRGLSIFFPFIGCIIAVIQLFMAFEHTIPLMFNFLLFLGVLLFMGIGFVFQFRLKTITAGHQ